MFGIYLEIVNTKKENVFIILLYIKCFGRNYFCNATEHKM